MNSLLFEKRQFKYLAFKLKCNPKELEWVISNIDECYYEYQEFKKDKTGNFKRYKDGIRKKRTISPSYPRLKRIQWAIKKDILDKVEIPIHIQGGVKGKSNITNAKIHQGKRYKFTTDLNDFFPSLTHSLVYGVFLKFGFSNHQASVLTKLTTFNYCLPQGAPTSPHLSNFAFFDIDEKLLNLAKLHNITYTRFIDDLTFSSPTDFKHVVSAISGIITSTGFKISHRKTSYNGNQVVTGIQVHNNFIDGTIHIQEKAKQEQYLGLALKPITQYLKRIRKTNKLGKKETVKH